MTRLRVLFEPHRMVVHLQDGDDLEIASSNGFANNSPFVPRPTG